MMWMPIIPYVNGMGVLTSADLIEQDSLSYLTAEKIYMSR